ncbi:Transmembrane protein of unknown function [Micrococcales bacterium KH10]|nr:Transmembrane protein of unknown function [Micrococcales bacterium KH10]
MAKGNKTNAKSGTTSSAVTETTDEANASSTGTAPVRRSAKAVTQGTAVVSQDSAAQAEDVAASAPTPATPAGAASGATRSADAAGTAKRGGADKKSAGIAGGAAGVAAQGKSAAGPRRVRLTVSRLDPWSVLKFSFLISFAVGIMIVVAAAIFWLILDGMHVFTSIDDTIAEIAGDAEKFNILQWVTFERTMSMATIVALIDVVVLTVLSTVFSLLYNLTATLVGGVTVTLTDE